MVIQSTICLSFFPYCMFNRSGEKQYEVSMMTGIKKRLEKALDENYSDEEREEHARQIQLRTQLLCARIVIEKCILLICRKMYNG